MPALQVKDFPPDLYEELRECAAQQDRSISQQTVRILREYLQAHRRIARVEAVEKTVPAPSCSLKVGACSSCALLPNDPLGEVGMHALIERRKKIFEKIHALPQLEASDGFADSAELVRQMREERDRRLDFGFDADGAVRIAASDNS